MFQELTFQEIVAIHVKSWPSFRHRQNGLHGPAYINYGAFPHKLFLPETVPALNGVKKTSRAPRANSYSVLSSSAPCSPRCPFNA